MQELVEAARKLNDAVNMIDADKLDLSDRVILTKLNIEVIQTLYQLNKLRQWMLY